MNSSDPRVRNLLTAVVGAGAGVGWPQLFAWWSRRPALLIYEQVDRRLGFNNFAVVMGTDLLFAIVCGLLAAELFIRAFRPHGYRPEAIAVAAFLAAALVTAQMGGEGAQFLLQLPPFWLTLLSFGIRVGYGIKAERKRRLPSH